MGKQDEAANFRAIAYVENFDGLGGNIASRWIPVENHEVQGEGET